jgi:hypothetical protein
MGTLEFDWNAVWESPNDSVVLLNVQKGRVNPNVSFVCPGCGRRCSVYRGRTQLRLIASGKKIACSTRCARRTQQRERMEQPQDKDRRRCTRCREEKAIGEFYGATPGSKLDKCYDGVSMPCKACRIVVGATRREANLERVRRAERSRVLLKKYDMTYEEYEAMYAKQGGRCACCGDSIELTGTGTHVDHDHLTQAIRGILCHFCNTAEGMLKGSVERARMMLAYIERNVLARELI